MQKLKINPKQAFQRRVWLEKNKERQNPPPIRVPRNHQHHFRKAFTSESNPKPTLTEKQHLQIYYVCQLKCRGPNIQLNNQKTTG
jgi:hypothetical protein